MRVFGKLFNSCNAVRNCRRGSPIFAPSPTYASVIPAVPARRRRGPFGAPRRGFFVGRWGGGGAEREEVVGHAEARRFEQPERALPGALLETRLHRPDFAHGRGEPAGDGELAALRIEHFVHRGLERGNAPFAVFLARLPGRP